MLKSNVGALLTLKESSHSKEECPVISRHISRLLHYICSLVLDYFIYLFY